MHGPVAEQPHADVGEIEVVALQLLQSVGAGLLQHLLQHLWRVPVGDEHPMIAGHAGIEPQPVAHHIGLRHWRQGVAVG